jgi:hypothetical protein
MMHIQTATGAMMPIMLIDDSDVRDYEDEMAKDSDKHRCPVCEWSCDCGSVEDCACCEDDGNDSYDRHVLTEAWQGRYV